jgi:hypothetical protein
MPTGLLQNCDAEQTGLAAAAVDRQSQTLILELHPFLW